MQIVVSLSLVAWVLEVECWNVEKVEKGSPVVRSSGVGIISCQEIEILLRLSKSRIAFDVDFVDPQFPPMVVVGVDFEEHLVQ
jgi:hypothetical protein